MTKDEVVSMARQAGFNTQLMTYTLEEDLLVFASMVAEQERNECLRYVAMEHMTPADMIRVIQARRIE
jgi:hypothetical protein